MPIDVKKTTAQPTPDAWKGTLSDRTVEVLPLARDGKGKRPGWCTYTYEHEQAPEVEVICGGVNSKTPKAGAVWRQGHLLHFGFDLAPSEMTDAGRALLVNAIAYAARFTDDRPIVRVPSVFVEDTRIFDRRAAARALASEEDMKRLEWYLSDDTYKQLRGKSLEQAREWFKETGPYLQADKQGRLVVDPDARSFGVPPAGPEFFAKAIAALSEPDRAALARKLLGRYAPDGPGEKARAVVWKAWSESNGPYLFFSDTGGYRWLIDPLAKERKVPTGQLRGPARATLPPLKAAR